MDFTVHGDPAINRQVEEDLDRMRSMLLREFEGVEALVLVGGFGRGEGGVVREGGRYRPENDYDIELIGRSRVDPARLHALERDLARSLGIRWVHIENHTRCGLGCLTYTQYVFDLKYGGHVFYGPEGLLDEIPEMPPCRMPLAEGEKLLFTRLWCFLGPLADEFRTRPPDATEAAFMAGQMSKALLAVGEARLMCNGAYTVKYAERLSRLETICAGPTNLLDLIRWATRYKLRPDRAEIPEPVALYHRVRRHYLQAMFDFVQTARGRSFSDWQDYAESIHGWIPPRPKLEAAKRAVKALLGRRQPDAPAVDLLRLKLYVVIAYGVEAPDPRYIDLARQTAHRLTGLDTRDMCWEGLRLETLKLLGI